MSAFYQPRRGRRPSSTDWLQILDVDGPFLAAPVVHDTWPDGLPALSQSQMDALRAASTLYDANPGTRDAFISRVLTGALDWRHNLGTGPDAATFNVTVPEHRQTVDITFVLRAQDQDGAVDNNPLLLGMVLPPKTATTGRAPAGSGSWTAGPADRLAHALRMRKVPLGIVTNGDTWTLVTVSDGGAVSTATWTRHAWLEEPQTLRAFVALLTRTRFYGVPDDQTLPGLLSKSLARQEEVTERLAEQSQAVVEMLVATLGRLDAQHQAEHGARLLPPDVGPAEVYQAAVTVLMRLVFLLYAEERGLLPLDDDTYASAYAVNTLADSLRDRATDHGEDALERTATGWYRLLALFRGVHRGARHEQLVLPAYGGSLFDPDRFPWLEGRATADDPLGNGQVPAIDDRTLLKALDSLQTLQFAKERRQVSYRSLDVEQIGYVYEGLLDQDALTASDWVVSIAVSDKDPRKNGPELLLTELEHQFARSDDALATWLVEQIKDVKGNRSKTSVLKALSPLEGDDKPRYERLVREACGNDDSVTARVLPFAKLLRLDPRDLPVVYPPGSLYLTDSTARASTGAVYTPRFLAEEVVETTLEAIVYSPGPLDTKDKSTWVIKSPAQILNLKVCDIAAGSGAFLVAATRYLAERLLESRRQVPATPALLRNESLGSISGGENPSTIPGLSELAQARQDEIDARRAVIDHCIYGVDINPMAVEMAKLSLWLTTLDRNRPFSFLDDRLVVGDSLLGINSVEQIRYLHFDPKKGRSLHKDTLELFNVDMDSLLKAASELRTQIVEVDLRDSRDAQHKQRLLSRASELTAELGLVADGLSGASLTGGRDSDYLRVASEARAALDGHTYQDTRRTQVERRLGVSAGGDARRPAHFGLLFPEVWSDGRDGFDAVVGNPPFVAGTNISGTFGGDYLNHLVAAITTAPFGRADLAAIFLRRAASLVRPGGTIGLIATNSLTSTDSMRFGTQSLLASNVWSIYASVPDEKWPTSSAAIRYCIIWACQRPVPNGLPRSVGGDVRPLPIGAHLRHEDGGSEVRPLAPRKGQCVSGAKLDAQAFVVYEGEALSQGMANSHLLRPLLNGKDFNALPYPASPAKRVLDFGLMSEEVAKGYGEEFEWLRARMLPELRLKSASYASWTSRWWQFWRPREELSTYRRQHAEFLAIAGTSDVLAVDYVPANTVPTHALYVFLSDQVSLFGLLSSAAHLTWVERFAGSLRVATRYTPSDVFETLPTLLHEDLLVQPSKNFLDVRRALQARTGAGLLAVAQMLGDKSNQLPDVERLRHAQRQLDLAVLDAYGLVDVLTAPTHDYEVVRGLSRFTFTESNRSLLLKALIELNVRQQGDRNTSKVASAASVPTSERAGLTLFGDA